MVDWSALGPLDLREILNGAVLSLSIVLLAIMCLYLLATYRMYGRGWSKESGTATACALAWMLFAEACRSGVVWYTLRAQNDGAELSETFRVTSDIVLVVAGVILVLSLLRCTFIFTPPHLGNWTWIFSLLLTSTFLSLSLML